jgi:hypothetical protein
MLHAEPAARNPLPSRFMRPSAHEPPSLYPAMMISSPSGVKRQ